jgi:RHS repeat-associated protein
MTSFTAPLTKKIIAAPLSYILLSTFLLLLLGSNAIGQSAIDGSTPSGLKPGSPAGSYALSGFDNVNPYNGGLNFHLPLIRIVGRGNADYTMMLPIQQKWLIGHYFSPSTNQHFYWPDPNWWGNGMSPGLSPGVMQARSSGIGAYTCENEVGPRPRYYHSLTRLTFTTGDGTEYELRDQLTNGKPADELNTRYCLSTGFNRGRVFVTSDGTSATFTADQDIIDSIYSDGFDVYTVSGYLMMRDGTQYRLDNGQVSWIRDRNGNKVTFTYGTTTTATDSLNRQVSIQYNATDAQYGAGIRITYSGFGGASRSIFLAGTSLGNALRSGYSTQTYNQLFGFGGSQVFNPNVTSSVWLPDGRRYRFFYNSYGELARVELPTGGAIEYDYTGGLINGAASGEIVVGYFDDGAVNEQVYRRVVERRVYKNSGDTTPQSKTIFSRPESSIYQSPYVSTLGYVDMEERAGDGTLLTMSRHYYYGSAGASMAQTPVGYSAWKEGREYKTEIYNVVNGQATSALRRVENTWQQRATVSWWSWWVQQYPAANIGDEPPNDPRLTQTVTTLVDSNQVAQQTFSYDQYSNQTDLYEYDYGAGGAGTFVRRTHTDYLTTNPVNGADYTSTNIHIRSLPTQQSVYDGNNVERARTTYEYDNYASDTYHVPLIYRPGITGLDSAFNTFYGTRGNATRISRWLLSSGTSINTYAQYDIAGNGVKAIDGRGLVSLLDYSSSYQYAYPTHTTSPTPDVGNNFCSTTPLETTTAYDLSTGLVTSSTDPNGQTITIQYNDVLDRPTAVLRPDGGRTTYTYVDVHQCGPYVETRTLLDTSGRETDDYVFFDGLGRSVRAFKYDGQDASNPYLTTDTQYDSLGRVRRVSNPYRSSGCTSTVNPSGNWTTNAYDALGRVLSVTTPDSAQVTTNYSGNQVMVQDPKGKSRRSVTDALGRLAQVIEDPAGLAYQTSYTYDVLGNLSTITQGTQHRYFMYDSLSRLIRAKNPEQDANTSLALSDPISGNSQWSIGYNYDANSNLATKTDARGVTSTYTYDNLNRSITVSYSDGTHIDRIYDSATNGRGRLRGSYQYPNTGAYSHTAIDTYDAVGRPRYQRQHFYASGAWGTAYVTQRNYDYAGHVTLQTYPSGRVVNYAYDQTGRTNSYTGNLGDGVTRTYAGSIAYDEWNGLSREQFGTDTPLYHKEKRNIRGQLYDMRLSTVNDSDNWNRGAIVNYYSFQPYGWGTSGPDNNGNLLVQQHWVPTDDAISNYTLMQQNYDYDALNRLKWLGEYQNAATNTAGQDYSYDRFGNRSMTGWGTGTSNQPFSVDTSTNRLGVPSGQYGVMQYDAAGNLTNDTYSGTGTRSYDVENRMVSATNNAGQQSIYTYDAEGRRVRRNSYGQETWQAYGMDGELIAEYAANVSPSSPQKEYGYRNGQLLITASGQSCGVGYQGTKTWAATSPSLGHVVGHQEGSDWVANVSTDSANFMVYGPYDNTFGQGHHTARFLLQVDNTSGSDVVATIDVVTGYGSNYLAQRQIRRNEFTAANQWQWFTLEFDNPCFGVLEARVLWHDAVNMRFSQSTISGVNSAGGIVQWTVADQLGTPRMIADKTGSLAGIKRHDYLPFGEELFAGTGNRTVQNGYAGDDVRQKFTGYERDNETGLDYAQARFYSSPQGRFTSVDPLAASAHAGNPQSWNRYAYVGNNPLNNTDLSGMGPDEDDDDVSIITDQQQQQQTSPLAPPPIDSSLEGSPEYQAQMALAPTPTSAMVTVGGVGAPRDRQIDNGVYLTGVISPFSIRIYDQYGDLMGPNSGIYVLESIRVITGPAANQNPYPEQPDANGVITDYVGPGVITSSRIGDPTRLNEIIQTALQTPTTSIVEQTLTIGIVGRGVVATAVSQRTYSNEISPGSGNVRPYANPQGRAMNNYTFTTTQIAIRPSRQ